jgi:hypothetical protein
MLLISHRGNLNGPNPQKENSFNYILKALKSHPDLEVEVDLWRIDNKWYLGHDKPEHRISFSRLLLSRKRLWFHCKNLEALSFCSGNYGDAVKAFWHEEDKYTLTTNRYIWTFPNQLTTKNSILVVLKKEDNLLYKSRIEKNEIQVRGICTDYPTLYLT